MALYQATIDDKPYIMALYTEAIGSEGCTWVLSGKVLKSIRAISSVLWISLRLTE